MVDSHDSRNSLPPAELVGNRIGEDRLFEARFLFEKFSSAIDPAVREQLQRKLTTRIAHVEKAFAQGELLEQAGQLEKAAKVYEEVAGMAVDFPPLARAQQRVEIAIMLGPLQPDEPLEPKAAVSEPSSPIILPQAAGSPVPWRSFFQQKKVVLLLVISLLGVLGFVFSLILFGPEPEVADSVVEPAPASVSQVEEAEIISIDRKNRNEPMPGEIEAGEKNSLLPSAPVPAEKTVVEAELLDKTHEEKLSESLPVSQLPEQARINVVLPVEGNKPVVSPGRESELSVHPIEKSGEEVSGLVSRPEGKEIYTVRAGDTLEAIAARVYGDRDKWSQLVEANKEKLGRPPYVLSVGMHLQVPCRLGRNCGSTKISLRPVKMIRSGNNP